MNTKPEPSTAVDTSEEIAIQDEQRKVDNALWEMDMERLEWERLHNDIYVGIRAEYDE